MHSGMPWRGAVGLGTSSAYKKMENDCPWCWRPVRYYCCETCRRVERTPPAYIARIWVREFIFAAGSATCSGYGASRLGPLLQAALAAGVAAGRLYGGQIDIPVLIQDVVPGQKLYELAGGRAR